MVNVQYSVLGPFGFSIDGQPQAVGGPKQRALFAALVIARGRTVSSESLANAAWNDEPPPNFAATLQVYIAGFRRLYRDAGLDPKAHLLTAAPGYRLVVTDDASDLARYDTAVRTARAAVRAGRLAQAATAFRSAITEFSGEVLADLQGVRFADEFAAAMHEQHLDAITEWAAAENGSGHAAAVAAELAALARRHPLREPLWEQWVTALYTVGRQSDALEACRVLRSTLADELGIDPSQSMQSLESRILRQEPLRPIVNPEAFAATVTDDNDEPIAVAYLVTDAGKSFPIQSKGLQIGRMPDNDIVVDHPKASRYHAVVSASPTGFVIRDLRSSNGTRVNDHRIADTRILVHGDRIGIGAAEFSFETSHSVIDGDQGD